MKLSLKRLFHKPPLVLWDIDGPLNRFKASGLGADPRFVGVKGDWNSGLFDSVNHPRWGAELLALGAKFVWVSNWADEANLVKDFIGLSEPIPHIPLDDYGDRSWKLSSVKLWVDDYARGAPLIWVDDELHEDAQSWAEERGNTLLIHVDAAEGWTFEQFSAMKRWLAPR